MVVRRTLAWWIGRVAFAVLCLIITLFSLFALVVMLSTALKEMSDVFHSPATWIPHPFAWHNFQDIWRGVSAADKSAIPFARWLGNSLLVSSATGVVGLLVVIPAAYALAKVEFAGKRLVLALLLAVQMFSPIVIIVPLFRIMTALGLLDSFVSLVLMNVIFASAFGTWLLTGFFQQIPRQVEQAARLDGCTRWQVMWRILVPLVAPGLAVTAIYIFILTWNEFLFAFTFINSDSKRTFMVGIQTMLGASAISTVQWNYLMTGSLFAVLPVLVLFIAIRRHLQGGMVSGAVKQ